MDTARGGVLFVKIPLTVGEGKGVRYASAYTARERRGLVEHVLSLGGGQSRSPAIETLLPGAPEPLNSGDSCIAYDPPDERHSEHFVFLSDIGGCDCLANYLIQPFPTNARRIVVIDRECSVSGPLLVPQGVTLRGCGMHGPGRLLFVGDYSGNRINMGTDQGGSFHAPSALEDLTIDTVTAGGTAVNIYGENKRLSRVRIAGFETAVRSHPNTRNVVLDSLVVPGLAHTTTAVVMRGSTWRVRQCFIRDTLAWAIDCDATDVVIESCRFENNGDSLNFVADQRGAMRIRGSNVAVIANYCEQNGYHTIPGVDDAGDPITILVAIGTAVSVAQEARRVRIIANFLAADAIVFDNRQVALPGVPNALQMFLGDGSPTTDVTTAVAEGRHSYAFNTDDDHGTNFYPHRALITSRVSAVEIFDEP